MWGRLPVTDLGGLCYPYGWFRSDGPFSGEYGPWRPGVTPDAGARSLHATYSHVAREDRRHIPATIEWPYRPQVDRDGWAADLSAVNVQAAWSRDAGVPGPNGHQ